MSVTVSQAFAAFAADTSIASQAVEDTLANIIANIDSLSVLKAADNLASVKISGTANTATLAQVNSILAVYPGLILSATGSPKLIITDSAANILNAANSAALGLSTTVSLTGVNSGLTVAQANTLATSKFVVGAGASLLISDTATAILSGSAGVLKGTGFTLTGQSNTATVAQSLLLAAKPGFSLASGATLEVTGSASELLLSANTSGVAKATTVTLTGQSNSLNVANATLLAAKKGFNLDGSATLVVTDSAANLLVSTAATALTKATSVKISGIGNTITAAQAATFAASKFTLDSAGGATLVVADTAANIIGGDATGIAKATALSVTGTVTATQAETIYNTTIPLLTGTTLSISATAGDILDANNSDGVALAGTFTVTGTATAAQAKGLADLSNFVLKSGTTLTIADTAANIANATNAIGVGKASAFSVTGAALAADATILAGKTNFSLVSGTTLTIADTVAHIVDPANATGVAKANSVTLLANETATAAQATSLAAIKNFASSALLPLVVIDTAANLLSLPNAAGVAKATTVKVKDANVGLTAAQLATLAAKPNFALFGGATLEVSDTATNLLSSGSTTALNTVATKVTLTGATNTVTAAQAATLSAMAAFTKAGTLVVADSAANILGMVSATVGKTTTIKLTGVANVVTVAQAAALVALAPKYTRDTAATLTVSDTAANLLDPNNSAAIALGTSFKLTNPVSPVTNTVTVNQAATLAALTGFALNSGATLIVSDTATNLLTIDTAKKAGIAAATTVKLLGTSPATDYAVTALQATALAGKTGFTKETGANLVLTDTAANLLLSSNAAGVAKASSFVLTGINNTATAAQVTAWGSSLTLADTTATNYSRLVIADTAANLLLSTNSGALAKATTVTLTGVSNTVNAVDAAALVAKTRFNVPGTAKLVVTGDKAALLALSSDVKTAATSIQLTGANASDAGDATLLSALGTNKFSLATGATLVITDTKANLIDVTANAPGLAKATTIKLSGDNTATAAEATTLAGKPNFALATLPSPATLVIADSADNILSVNNVKGVAFGTTFTLTGTNLVNAANMKLLAAKPNFSLDANASIYISDTAANILSLASLTVDILHHANTTVQLLGSNNTVTAADAKTLAGSTGFSFAPGSTLTVQDTAANIMNATNSTGVAKATTVKVTGESAAILASEAKTLAALPNFTLNAGATLPVTDSAANLLDPTNAAGVAKATTVKLSGQANSVSVSDLNLLLAKPNFAFDIPGTTTLTVADTAANLMALSATTTAKTIPTAWSLTGQSNLLSAADANTLRQKLGFSLANLASLEVVDTAANILTVNYGPATKVTLSGTANAVTVAEARLLAAKTLITRPTGVTLTVSGNAADLLNGDNAAGVALATAIKLTGSSNTVSAAEATTLVTGIFALNSGATLTLADNAANILALGTAIRSKATTVTVTESPNIVTAAEAKTLASLPNISVQTSLDLTDTSANILATTNVSGLNKATKVTLLSGSTNTVDAVKGLQLVQTPQFSKVGATLVFEDTSANLVSNTYSSVLTNADSVQLKVGTNNVTVAQAVTLAGKSLLKNAGATLTVIGSAADLLAGGNAAGLLIADAVKLSGTTNPVTAAQATTLAGLASNNFTLETPGPTTLVVTDSADHLLTGNAAGLAKATTVILSGTANTGSATDAAALALLNNFALDANATLVITDGSTALLATANATGVSKATTVILSGASNTVTASQATSLVMKPNFALEISGTTKLLVQDTAANILGAGPGVSKATSFEVTGTATVALATSLTTIQNWAKATGTELTIADTGANLVAGAASAGMTEADKFQVTGEALAADATTLAPNAKLLASAPLVIADTAANLLLAGNAAGLTAATTVKLTGTSNIVTAADATTLAGANGFAVKPGATLVIQDTAANLVTALSSAGMTASTSFSATDTADAAQATSLKTNAKLDSSALVVIDTSANLLTGSYSTGINAAATVKVSGTANTVSAAQATTLSGMHNFALDANATLIIADTAANLKLGSNSAGRTKATNFQVTGDTTNADATVLAADAKWDNTSALVVADTAANLIAGHGAAGLTNATAVKLIGTSNIVTAAEADQMANEGGSGGFTLAGSATLVVADTAAHILAIGIDVSFATTFDVSTDTAITAANAKDLEALGNFNLVPLSTMLIVDTAAHILDSANAAGVAKATAFDVSADPAITAANAKDLAAKSNFVLNSGTTMVIVDTAANILTPANSAGVAKATSFDVSADTAITAADAKNLKALSNFALASTMLVSDSAANLLMTTNAAGLAAATTVKLTGTSNTVTAGQAKTMQAMANFALDAGATLLVSDTAANILTGANLNGIKKATKFQVKGTASVSQANDLAALSGLATTGGVFTVSPTNGLVIEGTASDILDSNNSTGQALAASFKVTGDTTAAQATTLAALGNFAIASGTTLAITDSAANILLGANSTGVAKADYFSVTGTVDATTATTLAALMNFRVTPTTGTLVVVDTAANILDNTAYGSGVSLATTVKLTGANEVTAAQAHTLKAKPNFDVNGATLVVTGSSANLTGSNYADGVALATTVKLTGTSNAVDAATAKALAAKPNFALAGGATLVITDTAANLLSTTTSVINGVTVSNASGVAKASDVHLTGTSNIVSAAQALTLKNMSNFVRDTNQTLVVLDTAANLLGLTDATGLAAATAVKLAAGVVNKVSAAESKALAAKIGFVFESSAATLIVEDTAANLLLQINQNGVSKATTVNLIDPVDSTINSVNAADATTLAGRPNFTKVGGASLTVIDTAAQLLLQANLTGVGAATTVKLTGTSNTVSAADATTLKAMTLFGFDGSSTLTVADSAANLLLSANSTGVGIATTKKITGSNTVTVAQAKALVDKSATVDSDNAATLIVSDTYENLVGANTAGLTLATGVEISGANAASASAAKTMSATANGTVSLAANATLVVTDTAANLLDTTTSVISGVTVSNATGVALASSVKLSGTANTVTVAQAAALKLLANSNFSLSAGATLVVADTATNLLASPSSLTAATKIKLQTNATATANQATLLKANAKLDATTFVVADTAANILSSANNVGVAAATAFKLTGENTGLTAAQAQTLATKQSFSLDDGTGAGYNSNNTAATFVVCDSAVNLLLATNAAGLASATTVKMTGTTNAVTAAQAATLYALGANKFVVDTGNGSTMVVTDTAANLLGAGALPMGKATGVKLSGTSNTVTAAEALTLSGMSVGFGLVSGATLNMADTAANILAANPAAMALATTVTLKNPAGGTNPAITAAQAATLAAKPNFTLAAGASLVISDSTANILAPLNSAGVGRATAITVSGAGNVVSAAQAAVIAAKPGITIAGSLMVKDTAANILLAANASGVAKATDVKLTGSTNSITAAVATTLAGLVPSDKFTFDTGATLVVADTSTNLLSAANAAGVAKATSVLLTGTSNTLTAAQAQTLASKPGFALGAGAALVVADTAANLLKTDYLTGVSKATTVQLSGVNSSVLAADVAALGAKPNFLLGPASILTVVDTLANIKAKLPELEIMASKSKISSIILTDSTLTMTAADYFASTALRGKITTASKANLALSLEISATSTDINNASDVLLANVSSISAANAATSVNIDISKQILDPMGFTLIGSAGADTIKGGATADTIKGGAGADLLTGGVTGANVFDYTTLTDSLISGYDTITDFKDADKIKVDHAIAVGDFFTTSKVATGNLTFDLSTALTAANYKANGATFVTLTGTGGGQYLVLNNGTAAFNSATDAVVKIVGSAVGFSNLSFAFTNDAAAQAITGSAGDDTFYGFLGADTFDGGAGTDTIVLTATSADLNAASDAQILAVEKIDASSASAGVEINLAAQTTSNEAFTITGGGGADTITGGSSADIIFAGAGDDTIKSFIGADTIDGGAGYDTLVVTTASLTTINNPTDAQLVNVEAVSAAAMTSAVKIDLTLQKEAFVITGGSNADTLTGGKGNDTFMGFVGADTVTGGDGTDTIILAATSSALNTAADGQIATVEAVSALLASAAVKIDLSVQAEGFTITGGSSADTLIGGAGNNTFVGFAGADTVTGGAGTADTIVLTATSSTLNTATDAQIVSVEAINASSATAGVTINLAGQTTTSEGFSITGGGSADAITGGSGNDSISTGLGDDTINGFVGADTLDGGAGADTLVLAATSSTLNTAGLDDARLVGVETVTVTNAGAGVELILSGQTEALTITGGAGADTITGGAGADSISGGAGNDMITGFVGADTIDGGAGNDTLVLTATAFTINNPTDGQLVNVEAVAAASGVTAALTINLTAQTEAFTITGGGGADVITGGSAADSITGGAGNDTINGFVGADTIDGGAGNDTLVLTATSADLNTAGATDTRLVSIEAINASANTTGVTITLTAQSEGFSITGGAGADVITGGSGGDSIVGGAGNDTINGFVGADTVNGGDGTDTIVLAAASSDLVTAGADNARLTNVEAISAAGMSTAVTITLTAQTEGFSIAGGSGGDTITGGSGNDNINAGAGDDTINGFVGADTINGGDGVDTIVLTATSATLNTAGTDNTRLVGVEAINASTVAGGVIITLTAQTEGFSITGGAGADALTGGLGNDTFIGFAGADTITGGAGVDTLVLSAQSDDLNTAAATDARIVTVEAITAAAGVTAALTINLSAQTEGFAITGGSGADTITGAKGADNISGGAGNDTINGFAGTDTVNGGDGTDTIVLAATSTDLNAAGLADTRLVGVEAINASTAAAGVMITLTGQTEGFTITGGVGADSITGGAGADVINTGNGVNMVYGFAGADTITGGAVVDTLVLTATATDLNSASNNQLVGVEAVSAASATAAVLINLASQTEAFTITGGGGADSITGGSGNDNIIAGAGADMIYGFVGDDTVDGGVGADTIVLTATSLALNSATNAQIVNVEAVSATTNTAGILINLVNQTTTTEGFSITGGSGADTITGGSGADNITAGAGDDTINGFLGADTITGGDGADTLVLTATSTDLNTAGAIDARIVGVEAINASTNTTGVIITLSSQTEGFSLTGGSGADTLTGGAGADSITGGAGADTINGFAGADTVNGGDGADTVVLTATSSTLNSATEAQLVNVEAIIASTAAAAVSISLANQTEGFSLTGGAFADTLTGGAGADTIKGGAGADSLTGGLGANTYDYTTLKDSLISGFDTIADFKSTDKITYATVGSAGAFNTATRTATGNLATDLSAALTSTSFVANGATLVTLTGNGGGQYLVMNDATAAFSAAADTVVKIVGTAPGAANINVAITGTASNDTLKGGAGADTLTGGLGVNTYDYTNFTDSLVNGFDTITDFKSTDKIKLANTVASSDFKTATVTGTGNLATDLSTALTSTNFIASAATLVTVSGSGAGQYLVMNDATAAFNSSTDAVVKIVGSAVSSSNLTV